MVNWHPTELPFGVRQNSDGRLINKLGRLVYLVGGVCRNDYPITKIGCAYFAGDSCIESCCSETACNDSTLVTKTMATLHAIRGAVSRAVVEGDRDIVIMCTDQIWRRVSTGFDRAVMNQDIIDDIHKIGVSIGVHYEIIRQEKNIIAQRMAKNVKVSYSSSRF